MSGPYFPTEGRYGDYVGRLSGPLINRLDPRTIADLGVAERITHEHVAEAIAYRRLDRRPEQVR